MLARPLRDPAPRTTSAPRAAAIALIVSLGFAPDAGARRSPPAAVAEPAPPADTDALEEAQRLYEEGRAAYETFNYDAAIRSWTTALARVPTGAEAARIRSALVYNLAVAQRKGFALDGDVLRLKRARLLLERYLGEQHETNGADPEELARVQAQLDEIDAQLTAAEAPPAPAARESASVSTRSTTSDADPTSSRRRPGTVMLGVGAGLLVAGAGLVGGMATGIVISARAERRLGQLDTLADEAARPAVVARGELGNRTAIATGIVGGLALAAGTTLVILGARKRSRNGAIARSFGPAFGPGWFGVSAQVRL